MSDKRICAEQTLTQLTKETELCTQAVLFKIDGKGDWFYLEEPLPSKFARLFSSILYQVDGEYFLITPAEKLKVEVVDHPLVIVDYQRCNEAGMDVVTSLGIVHKISGIQDFDIKDEEITLTLERENTAKLGRACYYRFINEYILVDN
ncbi:DUF1285 domain-containing protein [Shewanella woodyi]|uniref:DUF1285 domain-containing protein n=1 Tax=Shewanella woodyi (strain ATCC 51908 / MS32) TaxID=392500 RepID=B1KID8_SHEWM|nr:DUF1285 domain-containing protein [Shewanella woodyi]ACA86989.1 protein of unknown function DUF1285 [Shewanella woodyi ATCC 51908]